MLRLIILFIFIAVNCFADDLAKITKISDGDTFTVVSYSTNQEYKVRLLWIDTPETYSSSKLIKDAKTCGVSKSDIVKLGKLATKYAKDYFRDGTRVIIQGGEKGYYGRVLGVIYKEESTNSYNYDVVNDGYACIYKKDKYPKEFEEAMLEAKLLGKGLWNINPKLMNCLCNWYNNRW
jgi:micrococcal nuclease